MGCNQVVPAGLAGGVDGRIPTAFAPGWNWVGQYFESGYNFTYEWWGWIYHAGKHGTWVNSIDGNSGDIN